LDGKKPKTGRFGIKKKEKDKNRTDPPRVVSFFLIPTAEAGWF
jgi:hypothetical protein